MKTAVVLAGGAGTRLLPLTEAINKHLLPIGREPMIYHPIKRLVEAGIERVLVVTGGNCPDGFISLLKDGTHLGLKSLYYAYQKGVGGIAEALKLAEEFVGKDDFAVILGDNIFTDSLKPAIDAYRASTAGEKRAKVFLYEVTDPGRFGCPEFDASGKMIKIIEKPKNPPSNYAVTGIYLYPASVFTEVLPTLVPSSRGELEITTVNNYYLSQGRLDYAFLNGGWSDAGTWPSWEDANKLFTF